MAKSAGAEELALEAIERALADPRPRKLHGTKANPGIFLTSSAAAKGAAQRCLDLGLIAPCGEERTRSKTTPLYGLTAAGLKYLLEHDPLRQLLAATHDGVARLAATSDACQQTLARVQQQVSQLCDDRGKLPAWLGAVEGQRVHAAPGSLGRSPVADREDRRETTRGNRTCLPSPSAGAFRRHDFWERGR